MHLAPPPYRGVQGCTLKRGEKEQLDLFDETESTPRQPLGLILDDAKGLTLIPAWALDFEGLPRNQRDRKRAIRQGVRGGEPC